jgi:dienelactone hydrolase
LPRLGLLLVALLAGACGGGSKPAAGSVSERAYGKGADLVWVLRQPGVEPRRVVVFVHGHGGQRETTPHYHRRWLRHLARRGDAVLYPRYELRPGGRGTPRHIVRAVATGLDALALDGTPPIVAIGYSRGGHLVVDYAAIAPPRLAPRAIASIFPAASEETPRSLRGIRPGTRMLVLASDDDEVVGRLGAQQLAAELNAAGYDLHDAYFELVYSRNGFTASHLSVLEDSPGARRAYWRRVDRFFDRVLGAD